MALVLASVAAGIGTGRAARVGLDDPVKKETAMQLVAAAENSSLDWRAQYAYIEYDVEGNAAENRGYTGGIIGFTSKTHDMLMLVERYNATAPGNELQRFTAALRKVDGTSSKDGLGASFELSWRAAARDARFRAAQDHERDRIYFNPSVALAKKDGLGALGQFAYYDAAVVHGFEGMNVVRSSARRRAPAPAHGGEERVYLSVFLEVRIAEMRREVAHDDVSRITGAQRLFLATGNLELERPLRFTIYGDDYVIR